jgi:hypothetical protein
MVPRVRRRVVVDPLVGLVGLLLVVVLLLGLRR